MASDSFITPGPGLKCLAPAKGSMIASTRLSGGLEAVFEAEPQGLLGQLLPQKIVVSLLLLLGSLLSHNLFQRDLAHCSALRLLLHVQQLEVLVLVVRDLNDVVI